MLSKVKIKGRWHYLTFFEGRKGEKKEQVLERWICRNPRKQRIVSKAKVVGGVVNVLIEYVYKKDLPPCPSGGKPKVSAACLTGNIAGHSQR